MSESIETYLIAQTSLRIVVDITFLAFYIFRIYKLDRMASNNFHSKPKSMKIKILLLILLEITFIIHTVLAFTDSSYWMHPYKDYSLVWIAQIIACLLQIYIIRKQHKKKSLKARSLPILWIFWLVFNIVMIVYTSINILNPSILVLIFSAIVLVTLIVIGCFFQSKEDKRQESLQTIDAPLIQQGRKMSQKTLQNYEDHDVNKLYVEFNKEFNIVTNQRKTYCEFKFAVYIGQESYILSKSQQQFIRLAVQMSKAFPQYEDVKLKQKQRTSISNMKKYGEQMQKFYQSYLVELTKNQKFYITSFLDFLQINSVHRIKLTKRRQKNLYVKKQQLSTQNDDEKNQKPFFKVEVISNKIHVSNPEILEIIVNKSRQDIQKFHNRLVSQKKLRMQLLTTQADINQISHFIFRVVNSKNLWRLFSEWMALGKQLQQKIYNMFDFWVYGFKNININIIGYEIAFDQEGSIHNLYLLSLTQKMKKDMTNIQQDSQCFFKQDVTLKKRYNDFVKLDRNIKKFINLNNIKNSPIMSLPPKFSPFGTKTSPKSRQIYLDMYLNEVLKIQNINHCVKFLQFLQVDLGRFREEFYPINEQELPSQHISSFIIDELENKF